MREQGPPKIIVVRRGSTRPYTTVRGAIERRQQLGALLQIM